MKRVLAIALALLSLTGCWTNLDFHADHRVVLTYPREGSRVTLPLTVTWDVRNPALRGTELAVFVDRAPIAPGEEVTSVANSDRPCRATPGCPDETYLSRRHIFTTTSTSLLVTGLIDNRPSGRPSARDRHRIVIVILDASRRRAGEAAFSVDFTVAHP